jgi:hydroxymethylbilane synthase
MIPEHGLILGTRGSKLALLQARHVAEKLDAAGLEAEIRVIKTTSEYHPETSLAVLDRRDVFTRQLDDALLAGEIDLAVHSAKDVPTEIPDGISLAAITNRTHPGDALVSDEGYHLLEENGAPALPEGAVVATSSVRRRALLLHLRPDLEIVEIRGNVDTRVRKMREGAADALLLAHAGLERIELDAPYTLVTHDLFLPAVGQGALAVAVAGDHPLRGRIREALNEGSTERTVLAERAMLRALEGGCRMPVGARVDNLDDGRIRLRGVVVSPDGALVYDAGAAGAEPKEVGERVARELLEKGAAIILEEIREVRS